MAPGREDNLFVSYTSLHTPSAQDVTFFCRLVPCVPCQAAAGAAWHASHCKQTRSEQTPQERGGLMLSSFPRLKKGPPSGAIIYLPQRVPVMSSRYSQGTSSQCKGRREAGHSPMKNRPSLYTENYLHQDVPCAHNSIYEERLPSKDGRKKTEEILQAQRLAV